MDTNASPIMEQEQCISTRTPRKSAVIAAERFKIIDQLEGLEDDD